LLYRLGTITVEEIENVIGKVQINNKKDSDPDAPGMMNRHYAPSTTTFLVSNVDQFVKSAPDKKMGLLLFTKRNNLVDYNQQEILSKKGDLREAASNLYAAMYRLDKMNLDFIVAERFPDSGLGRSINDRLERACYIKPSNLNENIGK